LKQVYVAHNLIQIGRLQEDFVAISSPVLGVCNRKVQRGTQA